MLRNFNFRKYDWHNGTPLSNRYSYIKTQGHLIYATSCFLGLNQHKISVPNNALLDLLLTYNNYLCNSVSDCPMVAAHVMPQLILVSWF
jgi:hypothetical protein